MHIMGKNGFINAKMQRVKALHRIVLRVVGLARPAEQAGQGGAATQQEQQAQQAQREQQERGGDAPAAAPAAAGAGGPDPAAATAAAEAARGAAPPPGREAGPLPAGSAYISTIVPCDPGEGAGASKIVTELLLPDDPRRGCAGRAAALGWPALPLCGVLPAAAA